MKNKDKILLIAFYEMLGGSMGLYTIVDELSKVSMNQKVLLFGIPVAMLYSLYILSGFLLFKNKKVGYVLSIISQAIQLIYLKIFGLTFTCVAAVYLIIYYESAAKFGILFNFIGRYSFYYTLESGEFMLGINVLALVILSFLMSNPPLMEEE